MPFQKGESGNPQGRKQGSKNKSTAEIKNLMQSFISENIETLQTDFDALDPKDRLAFFERALRFILPTQQSQELNINSLSEGELDTLVNKILSNLK